MIMWAAAYLAFLAVCRLAPMIHMPAANGPPPRRYVAASYANYARTSPAATRSDALALHALDAFGDRPANLRMTLSNFAP
jgi:hypothetical protein